jgi:hypothetical protein
MGVGAHLSPRFTVLTEQDRVRLARFFERFADLALRVLVPGGHVFIATNPLLSHVERAIPVLSKVQVGESVRFDERYLQR